jgi:hypothetical protein
MGHAEHQQAQSHDNDGGSPDPVTVPGPCQVSVGSQPTREQRQLFGSTVPRDERSGVLEYLWPVHEYHHHRIECRQRGCPIGGGAHLRRLQIIHTSACNQQRRRKNASQHRPAWHPRGDGLPLEREVVPHQSDHPKGHRAQSIEANSERNHCASPLTRCHMVRRGWSGRSDHLLPKQGSHSAQTANHPTPLVTIAATNSLTGISSSLGLANSVFTRSACLGEK